MSLLQEPVTRTNEMTTLLAALTALKKGKTGVRLPLDWTGVEGRVADAFNDVVELNERMAGELARLSRVAGKEGKLSERMSLGDVSGFWDESVKSVNALIGDLVHPTSETARVIGAVAQGDLSQPMALEVDGVPLAGRILQDSHDHQQDGRSARLVCQRSHPRGARSGNRRKARRTGARARASPARGRT